MSTPWFKLVLALMNQKYLLFQPVLTVMWNTILHHFPLYAVQRTKASPPEFSINMQMYCNTYSGLIKKHWMEKKPVFRDIILITAAPKQVLEAIR
ncbi:hypothetical protein GCK32_022476 [Trichostrongylus colubriformis]|uniref:Uncharacterized protein n=1 Tax=Trichostrongylus colubriformis TaxID=6319 RepID=A0AAN8F723_TRICO